MAQKVTAVDLFCGAGGLTRGLQKSGIRVAAGIDLDPTCEYAFEYNNGVQFKLTDISQLQPKELVLLYPSKSIKLLAGCAPCQPFSKYKRSDKKKHRDEKWRLLDSFAHLINATRPELITMENVPEICLHSVYSQFLSNLDKLGYHFSTQDVFCPDYGIPQSRTRHVLLASRFGEIHLMKPTHSRSRHRTVEDAIAKLPVLAAGESDPKDPLHRSQALSPLNMRRIKASTPGGTWRDWPHQLRAECHKKPSGQNYGSVYSRMKWDEPSPTITTQSYAYGSGRFGHPEQDRALSLREAALLQTFPKSYKFVRPDAPVHFAKVGRMVGNAVPVRLGTVIGRSILRHVAEH